MDRARLCFRWVCSSEYTQDLHTGFIPIYKHFACKREARLYFVQMAVLLFTSSHAIHGMLF
jgi:hypothetical protein